jgi:hypothetical protein
MLRDRTSLRAADHPPGDARTGCAPRGRASGPQGTWTTAACTLVALAALHTTTEAEAPLRAASDLDGLHLWVGAVGAATRIEGGWDSAWGGSVSLVRIRERARLGTVGGWLGGAHYAVRDGGRVWLDGVAGTRWLTGRMIGAAVGPVVELGDLRHPRVGAQATIWCFAGVVPYARVGVLEASGSFVELGVSLGVPAWRL